MDEERRGNGGVAVEIADRVAEYLRTLTERRDADAAGDFYDADATLVGPGMDLDRSGIVAAMRSAFDSGAEIRVNRETVELFVHGDAAYEIAKAEDTFVAADGSAQTVRNNLFIRWVRGPDGRWRFARVLLSPRDAEGGGAQ